MPPKRMTANSIKPARYRPGKPLPGQRHSDSESEDDEVEDAPADERQLSPSPEPASKVIPKPAVISKGLKHVDLNQRFEKESSSEEESSADEAENEDDNNIGANDDDDVTGPGGDYASEESSSEESDSEDELAPRKVLLRPTFIPKSKRGALLAEKKDEYAEAEAEKERRRVEAEALVEEQIRKTAADKVTKTKAWDEDAVYDDPPDDTDDLDPAAERAAWKLRELLRMKRERDALELIEKEREEIERRKNMDESERYKEDMEYVKKQQEESKEKRGNMGFLQKYYHKGAFYQDDSEVLNRNYSTARVEDDIQNREFLPKALQIRSLDKLGKRGATKWTHLSAEDTSNLGKDVDNPWFDKKSSKFQALPGMRDERFMSDREREKKSIANGGPLPDRRRDDRSGRGDRPRGRDVPEGAPTGPKGRKFDREGNEGEGNWNDRRDDRRDVDRHMPRDRSGSPKDNRERGHDERRRSRSPRRANHDRDRERKRSLSDDRSGEDKRRRVEA